MVVELRGWGRGEGSGDDCRERRECSVGSTRRSAGATAGWTCAASGAPVVVHSSKGSKGMVPRCGGAWG